MVFLSIAVNVLLFLLVLHFRRHREDIFAAHEGELSAIPSEETTWIAIQPKLSQYIPTKHNIVKYFQNRVNSHGANYVTFAAFLCLNYILPYFMWTNGAVYRCNILTIIRFLGATMCMLLLLKNYWPTRVLKYFPVYWHATVMYVLPFSTTLSLLIMGGTTEWLINITLAIMMLSAIVDCMSFIILAVLGVGLGIICHHLLSAASAEVTLFSPDLMTMHHLTYTCIFSTSIGLLFLQKRRKETDKRLASLALFGKVVGTEMRNIVAMCKAYASNIQFSGKQLHIEKVLPPEDYTELCLLKADTKVYLSLQESVGRLMRDSEQGMQTIDRILANFQQHINTDDFTMLSMQACITNALALYNITERQKSGLLINLNEDFQFYGSAYYMQHILFNLLENVHKHSQKDCIVEVWLTKNRLRVKDSGSGIAREALPYIFDPFFTTAKAAMGMGLAFCRLVMEAFGGTIICKSKQGRCSYTEFVLTFPKLKKANKKEGSGA